MAEYCQSQAYMVTAMPMHIQKKKKTHQALQCSNQDSEREMHQHLRLYEVLSSLAVPSEDINY